MYILNFLKENEGILYEPIESLDELLYSSIGHCYSIEELLEESKESGIEYTRDELVYEGFFGGMNTDEVLNAMGYAITVKKL